MERVATDIHWSAVLRSCGFMSLCLFPGSKPRLTGESSKEIYAQCDENRLLQSYGFHSEANGLAIKDIKAMARRENYGERAAE